MNDRTKRNQANSNQITIVCKSIAIAFCAIIGLVILCMIFSPSKKESENENRMLEQRPHFSFSSFFDGSFMKDYEKYLTDQFPGRDSIVSMKSSLRKFVGAREENGVYFGSDGFLFEAQTPADKKRIKKTVSAVNKFTNSHKNMKSAFILSPNSSYILSDKLPYGHSEYDQKETLDFIKKQFGKGNTSWISCINAFSRVEDKESLFYRTDHHWTTRAAFQAFMSLSKTWNLNAKKKDYSFYTVSDSFSGTLSSYAGDRKIKDNIEICFPKKGNGKYTVLYESSNKRTFNLFESEKLKQKNQYEVFLGGNYDKVIITTLNQNGKSLLLFKDSYANCMIPMLTPYFEKIVVVDPRYFSDSLSGLISENEFTNILFVYNLNTFLSDSSLAPALQS